MNCLNDLDTMIAKAEESESSPATPLTSDHEPFNSQNGDLSQNNPSQRQQPAVEVVIPESHLIPSEKLGLLKDNERIRSLLESENLCQWIKKVKETPHTSLLSQAMKDPEFRAFSTAVLDLLGPKGHYNEPEETD